LVFRDQPAFKRRGGEGEAKHPITKTKRGGVRETRNAWPGEVFHMARLGGQTRGDVERLRFGGNDPWRKLWKKEWASGRKAVKENDSGEFFG